MQKKYKKPVGLKFKDKIGIDFFPVIATILNKVGFSWNRIGKSFVRSRTLIAQGKSVSKTLHPVENDEKLNIYFLTILGGYTHNISVDIVLAFGLKQEGHDVTFIINDQVLPVTDEKKDMDKNRWEEISAKSYYYGLRYIQSCGFEVLTISQIVDLEKKRDIGGFKHLVETTLLKHYKVGIFSNELNDLPLRKKMVEDTVRISALVGDYLLLKNPDRVIMSHGLYATWGPEFEILTNAGVPVVVYSKTNKKKTEKFNWNYTGDWWEVGKEWERVKDIPLTQKQEAALDQYLETRITHSEDGLVYNFGKLESKQETLKRFGLDPNKKTYSLFTNVLWDAASTQREIAFSNPVDWVIQTIEWFRNQSDKQLIVKIHPAEVVIGTNQPFAKIIQDKIKDLPDNVCIIKPFEKVNSWSIYEVSDVGIVHTTTAGMELVLVEVPCIVVSKTHYREKGFTQDIHSNKEYFELLGKIDSEKIDKHFQKIMAKRYLYLLFIRYQMPFELFDEIPWSDVRSFTFNTIEELFKKPYFNNIIQAIIHKREFLTEP
ncbi:MAG: hypothetical protein ABI261_04800 [Ginsengibacter sp.]